MLFFIDWVLYIGLYFSLRNAIYTNNSIIFVSKIGEIDRDEWPRVYLRPSHSLQCITDKMNCCRLPWRTGEWYFPNASRVQILGSGSTFNRTRGNDGSVNLNHRSDSALIETGLVCCMVPDAMENYRTLCANIGEP